ncbi:MAG: hypothetical protein WC319_15495 [Candidatus Paceibacterota bacterium]
MKTVILNDLLTTQTYNSSTLNPENCPYINGYMDYYKIYSNQEL